MATSHQAQVSDPEYHNWVRCVLGLKYTQEGLYPFIDIEARELHRNLMVKVSNELGVHNLTCNQCTINTLLPNHTPKTCPMRTKRNCICTNWPTTQRPCPANVCGKLYEAIVSTHRYNDPVWRNSDMSLWSSNHWEMAKAFLPSTGGYNLINSADNTDSSGLLNIAINMKDIASRHQIPSGPLMFVKCRDVRNNIFHSANQKLTDVERDRFIQNMIDVLECTPDIKTDQASQDAVAKLQLVRLDLYVVTPADIKAAQRIVTEGLERIQDKTAESLEKIDDKTAESLEKIDDKTAESLEKIGGATAESLASIEFSVDKRISQISQIQERVDKAYEENKAEFKRKQMQLVKERFTSTPVYDGMPDMVSVEVLFVKPNFEISEYKAFSFDKPKPGKVCSLKEMFLKGDTLYTRIYLSGDAGTGKTTFCSKLAHAWLHMHTDLDQYDTFREYTDIMKKFDFFFYLPLRSFRHLYKVEEMLQCYYSNDSADFFKAILSKESCLVVLDGLDEWGPPESYQQPVSGTYGLPDFGDIYQYTALVTTRPWKIEVLRPNSIEVNLHITLKGLDQEQIFELSKKMIDYLNKGKNVTKELHVFNTLIMEKKLTHVCSIPIILKQLLVLWYYRNEFGDTKCQIYSEMIILMLEQSQTKNKGLPISCSPGSKEKSEDVTLPQCFKPSAHVHSELLILMAKLAFKTLFNNDHKFPHNENIHGICESDMNTLLRTGIISQYIDTSDGVRKYKSLRFIHNSVQDFLAALYVCISDQENRLLEVFKNCKTMDKILEMWLLFVFLSGLSDDVAGKIPNFIQKVKENHSSRTPVSNLINLMLDVSEIHILQRKLLSCVLNLPVATSFMNQISNFHHQGTMQDFMIDCLYESTKLTGLQLWETDVIVIMKSYLEPKQSQLLNHIMKNNDIKAVIGIADGLFNMSGLLDCLSTMDSCPFIQTVNLWFVEQLSPDAISHLCKTLLHDRALTNIELVFYDYSNLPEPCMLYLKSGDFTNLVHLEVSIFESECEISHLDMQSFYNQVGKANALQSLELRGIVCSDHRDECQCLLDLTRQNSLQKLHLTELSIGEINLCTQQLVSCTALQLPKEIQRSITHRLNMALSLQTLTLSGIRHKDILDQVVSLLPCLRNLTELTLGDIRFKDRRIRLSPQAIYIKRINLVFLNISYESLTHFIESVPLTEHDVRFRYFNYQGVKLVKYIKERSRRYVVFATGPFFLEFDSKPVHQTSSGDKRP